MSGNASFDNFTSGGNVNSNSSSSYSLDSFGGLTSQAGNLVFGIVAGNAGTGSLSVGFNLSTNGVGGGCLSLIICHATGWFRVDGCSRQAPRTNLTWRRTERSSANDQLQYPCSRLLLLQLAYHPSASANRGGSQFDLLWKGVLNRA